MIKAYQQDWAYTELWKTRYTAEDAGKVIKKLIRHFKINLWRVYYIKNKCGAAAVEHNVIYLPKENIALQMICHELGHLLCYQKYGRLKRWHCKKAYKQIHKICKYAYRYVDKSMKQLMIIEQK